uniref:Pdgfa associated protein 1a n=1 Tax=Eptatretus burgeri TaxID=7764 RepID=A0A8C4QBC5_EPTBU
MPRGTGKKGSHKGRAKQFTDPEELKAQMAADKAKNSDEEAGGGANQQDSHSDSEGSGDEVEPKHKGVEGLIDIENPNRLGQRSKKVTDLDVDQPRELSRREREELEKQQAKERYRKLHIAGKTEQARADLARLAIIRKQREEAAKKREDQQKEKESIKNKQT